MKIKLPQFVNRKSLIVNRRFKSLSPSSLVFSRFSPGSLLIITIIFLAMTLFASITIFDNVANFVRFGSNQTRNEQAVQLVEAGIDYAVFQINKQDDYFISQGGFEEVNDFGPGDFHIKETDPGNGNKKITVTGFIPKFGSFQQKVTAQVEVSLSSSAQTYNNVIMTTGQLLLGESHKVVGNIHSNANITCGEDCSTGSNVATICGNATAVTTISNVQFDCGGSPTAPADPQTLSYIDANWWRTKAAEGGIQDEVNCTGPMSLGNTKLFLDFLGGVARSLIMDDGCVLTVTGPIWITGELIGNGTNEIILDESFGAESTVIIVDGCINFDILKVTPTSQKGVIILYSENDGGGGKDQPCPSGPAIRGTFRDSYAIVQAPNARIDFRGNDFGSTQLFGALISQEVNMFCDESDCHSNGNVVEFDPDVSSPILASDPPSAGWQIVRGTYKFTK